MPAATDVQAANLVEQSSPDTARRRIPTVAYKVQGPSAPIALTPVNFVTKAAQSPSDAGFSSPNIIIFSGAALGCFFAGCVLWAASRDLPSGACGLTAKHSNAVTEDFEFGASADASAAAVIRETTAAVPKERCDVNL